MEPLKGQKISGLPFSPLKKVADLVYFDGPLLALFKNERSDSYLYNWCDVDERSNRWLIFRVDDRNLNGFMSGKLSLQQLVLSPPDGFLVSADVDNEGLYHNLHLLKPQDLPDDYVPAQDSFYDEVPRVPTIDEAATAPDSYVIHIGSEWSLRDLSDLPNNYSKVYATLYSLQESAPQADHKVRRAYGKYPWKGGYSTVNFFRSLESHLPEAALPQIKSMQYASPGYIELDLDERVAVAVKNVITAFTASHLDLESVFESAQGELKRRRLIGDRKPTITKDDEKFLRETAQTFMRLLRIGKLDKLETLTSNPLAMLNLLRSFYRVVEKLARYEGEGKAHF
jgi:hypothetical protein